MERPDLTDLNPTVVAYIESLEMDIMTLKAGKTKTAPIAAPLEPDEPPTSKNIITISASGLAKRSPRHLYSRQRRSGMGVYDLDVPEEDPPTHLVMADKGVHFLLLTNHGRAYRLRVDSIPESTELREKGTDITAGFKLRPEEKIAVALPDQGGRFLLLASANGRLKRVRHNFLGEKLLNGTPFHNIKEGGDLVAAAWSDGDGDIILATRNGQGIRFREDQVSVHGTLGMRVDPDDQIMGIAPTADNGAVLLLGHDGKGTIRLMSGFRQNKAPGAGGKVLLKTERLMGLSAVSAGDDLFIVSKTGKLIRFSSNDIPPKAGVVQGVNCMALRSDEIMTAISVNVG